jgi:DNA repair exonuclease SbcCD ATPase subunit
MVLEVLAEGLAPFVDRHMSAYFEDDWIVTAATRMGRPEPVLATAADPQFQLEVIVRWWGPVFAKVLPKEARDTVHELRQARNQWAHIVDARTLDFDFAFEMHQRAADLLREVGSPLAGEVARFEYRLRFDEAREVAESEGITETEVLLKELDVLQLQRAELQEKLREAREEKESAAGRTRAVARQLADLQTQYAAVSGLKDQYEALQHELEGAEGRAQNREHDTGALAQQLMDARAAIESLHTSSDRLHLQLAGARRALEDPTQTEVGRRWLMLVAALVMVLGITILLAFAKGLAL